MNLGDLWNSVDKLSRLITAANWGIAFTLFVAFACTVVAIKAGNRKDELAAIEDLRKTEQVANTAKLAGEANERAAKLEAGNLELKTELEHAKEESAKAQLELRQYIDKKSDPQRRLNREKFLEHMEGKPTAKAVIWYKPEDTEAFQFAREIGSMLESPQIGWKVLELLPFPTAPRGTRQAAVPSEMHFIGAFLTGLTLRWKNRPGERGANEAGASLRDALMFGREGVGSLVWEGVEDKNLPDDVFLIVVGQRNDFWVSTLPQLSEVNKPRTGKLGHYLKRALYL